MPTPSRLPDLKNHDLFLHDVAICQRVLNSNSEIREVKAGEVLIKEGDDSNRDIYSILSGSFEVRVGTTPVATRGKYDHVGEMALVTDEPRSASVIATAASRVLCLTEAFFRELLEEFPQMWKPLAETLAERLRQRKALLREPNLKPRIFIGSSGNRLDIARQIKGKLEASVDCHAEVWDDPKIFRLSRIIISTLIDLSRKADFGIFIFGADDFITSKGTDAVAPRDNVVFEAGLFTGACGLERTFIIVEEGSGELKIPSDLHGVLTARFAFGPTGTTPDLDDAVKRISASIQQHGVK